MNRIAKNAFQCSLRALAATLVAGCGAIALLEPPTKSVARFILPEKLTVIVVENYSMRADLAVRADEVASAAEARLEANTKVPLVHWSKVYDLKSNSPTAYSAMTVAQIGKALGAEQVIYVNIGSNSVSGLPGGMVTNGSFTALVKVVDVGTSKTVWPSEHADGFPVEAGLAPDRAQKDVDAAAASSKISQQGGAAVAQLFYTFRTGS